MSAVTDPKYFLVEPHPGCGRPIIIRKSAESIDVVEPERERTKSRRHAEYSLKHAARVTELTKAGIDFWSIMLELQHERRHAGPGTLVEIEASPVRGGSGCLAMIAEVSGLFSRPAKVSAEYNHCWCVEWRSGRTEPHYVLVVLHMAEARRLGRLSHSVELWASEFETKEGPRVTHASDLSIGSRLIAPQCWSPVFLRTADQEKWAHLIT